jgi:hypothetical protein
MTIERLRSLHAARPFRPFTLHMADGGVVRVTHPEALAYGPGGRTIVVFSPNDDLQIIDLLLVSRIEVAAIGRRQRRKTG